MKSVALLVEKDLLVKIARREYLEISEGDTTPFSIYASAWLERKKAILARSTYGDYRSIWKKYVIPNEMIALKWSNVDFEMRCITVREGRSK